MKDLPDSKKNQINPATIASLDPDERVVLTAMRYFFRGFTYPETQAWMHAFQVTSQYFPPERAADIALGALSVVQCMRMSRREMFSFSNPNCASCSKVLCEEERQLIGIVSATRRGAISQAHVHAMLICEGNETAPTLDAAQRLSDLLAVPALTH